jgi:HAD superfamily hydrolase (TIGR01549 family)
VIKAVLLDLDDTLLTTHTDSFVQRYLIESVGALTAHFGPQLAKTNTPLSEAVHRAVGEALRNTDPTLTAAAAFQKTFAALTTLPTAEASEAVERYIAEQFDALREMTAPIDGAPELIEQLQACGLLVVVATNSLFPLSAIIKRLAWAGLEAPRQPFAYVTSLDAMHFTKPNPHFYEEILARIGVEADEALMVGDSIEQDMVAAAAAGLNTFWIDHGRALPKLDSALQPNGSGSLADFAAQVQAGWLETLQPRPRTAEQLAPRLIANVAALYGLAEPLAAQPDNWRLRPDPLEWSPLEIVCHLRDSERSEQRPRLQRIAREANPFISELPVAPHPDEQNLSAEDGQVALSDFWRERRETLNFLQTLRSQAWSRPARHNIFGPTTLLEMAHFTAHHDRLHIKQFCETVGRCRQVS